MRWGAHDVAAWLVESDCRYFELAARVCALPHADLALLPQLARLAAGCVVQRVDVERASARPTRWLDAVEGALGDLHVPEWRIYLTQPAPALEAVLRARGYRASVEVAYAAEPPKPPPLLDVALHPVASDADWRAKADLHAGIETGPDGHPAPAAAWVAMERARCATGEMEPWLLVRRGRAVGAVNVMQRGPLLRLKNLVVDPAFRDEGVGRGAAQLAGGLAAERGLAAMGCFALQGGAGERAYRAAGLRAVGAQVEWSCRAPVAP